MGKLEIMHMNEDNWEYCIFKTGQLFNVNSINQYLPGNTAGMENTHICPHFANPASIGS